MRPIRHTIGCRITGYESLLVTIDIGLTNEAIAQGQADGLHCFVLDFPNWDEAAESLELTMPKPALALTTDGLNTLPVVLIRYIAGGYIITDAIEDYMQTVRPFLGNSSGGISA